METYFLDYILSHDSVWQATTDEIAEYYMEHYYDKVVMHAASIGPGTES